MRRLLADLALSIAEWCADRAERAQQRRDRWIAWSKTWKKRSELLRRR